MPPGTESNVRASPPAAGRSHSLDSASSSLTVGSVRPDTKTSEPSGRNAGLDSPLSEKVKRRASVAAFVGTSQSEVTNRVESALSVWTVSTTRPPSGERTNPLTRGIRL